MNFDNETKRKIIDVLYDEAEGKDMEAELFDEGSEEAVEFRRIAIYLRRAANVVESTLDSDNGK